MDAKHLWAIHCVKNVTVFTLNGILNNSEPAVNKFSNFFMFESKSFLVVKPLLVCVCGMSFGGCN